MKKILILLAFLSFISCSEDDSEATGVEASIIRLNDTRAQGIQPKSIYINQESGLQITAFFDHNSAGGLQRLTQLVSEDGTGKALVLSFDTFGVMNNAYIQNTNTGEVTDKLYLIRPEEGLHYGDGNNVFFSSEFEDIDAISTSSETQEDQLIMQTLNQNLVTMSYVNHLATNATRDSANLGFVLIGVIVLYVGYKKIMESDKVESITCELTDSCGRSSVNGNGSREVSCQPLYSNFLCSENPNITDMLIENSNLSVYLCGDSICIGNEEVDLVGIWSIEPTNDCGFTCCGDVTFLFSTDGGINFVDVNDNGSSDFNIGLTESSFTVDGSVVTLFLKYEETFTEECEGVTQEVSFLNTINMTTTYSSEANGSLSGGFNDTASETPLTPCGEEWSCNGSVSMIRL